jgi:predicted nucleic acid-binding protein
LADVLVADSSGILAAVDSGEPDHRATARLLAKDTRPLVTIDFVLAEVDYLLLTRLGAQAEQAFVNQVLDGVFLREPVQDVDLRRAAEIAARFSENALGLTDSALMAVAERLKARTVLTLDRRHFSVFRDRSGHALELLPNRR